MQILVTGGAGFVGSNLIKVLKNCDNNIITSLDDYSSGFQSNEYDGVTYIHGHTQNIEDVLPSDYKPDIIYHFGEFSRIVPSFEMPDRTLSANLTGTYKVLIYAVKHKAKIIYSGSSSIFGNNMADQHLNPYSWSKAKNIELLHNFKEWFGLKFAICYFYNVYGPGQITEGQYATVIGIFEKQYKEGKKLTVVTPGTQTRAFTHINDIIKGIILVGDKGSGDKYFLGTEENISILDIVKFFRSEYEFIPERRGERLQSIIHESKARTELSWDTEYTLPCYVNSVISCQKE